MKDNGTDRDIALQLVSLLGDINTALVNINDHKFVPHVLTQPTDQEGDLNSTVTFTISANNVKSYQWQYKASEQTGSWTNSSAESATTTAYSVTVSTSNYYNNRFRCKITGLDNSIIYSDVVKITQPEAEG